MLKMIAPFEMRICVDDLENMIAFYGDVLGFKLISKIDEALKRIENGSYGYCEETGDPISIKRLEARPVATLSLEAQELHEKKEKIKLGI